ncbi:hypothetical protein [Streptomyces sp. NPDC046759]
MPLPLAPLAGDGARVITLAGMSATQHGVHISAGGAYPAEESLPEPA